MRIPHPKPLLPFPARATGGLLIASFSAFGLPEHLAALPLAFSWPVQLAAPLRSGGSGPQGSQGLPPSPSSPQGGLLHWPALQPQTASERSADEDAAGQVDTYLVTGAGARIAEVTPGAGATFSRAGVSAESVTAGTGAIDSITGALIFEVTAGAGAMFSRAGAGAVSVTAGTGAAYSISGAGAA